mmetsp:Transcript_31146/g.41372  ORF Transcript_31146/g.41372 Transcript_31146/m.41372 type:complete len:141 (+) Transcript_31146:590-1012(+)
MDLQEGEDWLDAAPHATPPLLQPLTTRLEGAGSRKTPRLIFLPCPFRPDCFPPTAGEEKDDDDGTDDDGDAGVIFVPAKDFMGGVGVGVGDCTVEEDFHGDGNDDVVDNIADALVDAAIRGTFFFVGNNGDFNAAFRSSS